MRIRLFTLLARLDTEIAARLEPVEETVAQLDSITGIGHRAAADGGGAARRDRDGHVPLPEPSPSGLVGEAVPGSERERRAPT